VPLGNGNFQGIAAGPATLPERVTPDTELEGAGQIILRQKVRAGVLPFYAPCRPC